MAMVHSTPDETSIKLSLARIAQGDESAFSDLFRQFSPKVYRFIMQSIQDASKAEELTNLTMFEVWKFASSFRGDSLFTTWLFGIAKNVIRMHYRGEARRSHVEYTDNVVAISDANQAQLAEPLDTDSMSVSSEQVQHCILQLSENHRQAIHLAFFEDMGVQEISAIAQVPPGTIKSRLFHARQQIQRCLQCLRKSDASNRTQSEKRRAP